jgi:hypothetical protein
LILKQRDKTSAGYAIFENALKKIAPDKTTTPQKNIALILQEPCKTLKKN